MKGKKIIIGILCGLGIAALGIGLWNFKTISNSIRRWTSTPEEYFYYIEERSAKEAISFFGEAYDVAKSDTVASPDTTNGKAMEGAVTVTFGDSIQNLWMNNTTTEKGSFSELGMKYKGVQGAEPGTSQCELTFSVNGSDVLNGMYWADNAAYLNYLQIPELSNDVLKISTKVPEEEYLVSSEAVFDFFQELYVILPEKDILEGMLQRYFTAALYEIKEVEEETALLSTEGVYMRCTKLTATLDGEELSKVLESVTEELLQDKDLEAFISVFSELAATQQLAEKDELYDEIYESLKELRYSARDLRDFEEETEITVWVDKTGAVVGRKIAIGRDNGIYYAVPREKNKVGFTFEIEADGAELSLNGIATVKKSELTGTYNIRSEGIPYFEGEVTADLKQMLRNKGNTAVTVTVCPAGNAKNALRELDEELQEYYDVRLNLQELSFELSFATKKDTSIAEYSFLTGDDVLLGISLEQTEVADGEVRFPEDKDVVELTSDAEFAEWLADADLQSVIDSLKNAGLPAEWFSDIEVDPKELKYAAALDYTDYGEYQRAKDIFFALGDYRDSAEYVYFCEGMLLYEKGDLEAAVALFDQIENNYWVMTESMNECKFALAEQYLEKEDYETAERLFYEVSLNQYYYSELCDEAYDMYCYASAVQHAAEGDYEAARDALLEVQGDYEQVQTLMEECQAQLAEQDALLQRPLHILGPVSYATYAEYAVLPERYTGIPMSKPTEEEYGEYIAWKAQEALNEGRELSEDELPKLREDCAEEKYTFAVMDYLLAHADVTQMDEEEIELKAKCDMYRFRLEVEAVGFSWESFLYSLDYTEEEMLAEYKEERRNREKLMILAYAIAQKEGLTVSEKEYDYFVSDMAEDLEVTEADFLAANPKEVLDEVFLVEKGMNFLIENAKIQ